MNRVEASLALLVGLAGVASACSAPATELLVSVGTDIPLRSLSAVRVRVRREGTAEWKTVSLTDARTVRWPFSFALVPASRETRDSRLEWTLTVTYVDNSGSTTSFERSHASVMIPGRRQHARVFLRRSCLASSTGCTTAGAPCTVAQRCSERGLTCGDDGACVERTLPGVELDRDAEFAFDVRGTEPTDVAALDSITPEDSGVTTDSGVVTDTGVAIDACVPNCGGRACGGDGCGGSCGACPMNSICDGMGQCVDNRCSQPRVSVYRHNNTMGPEAEFSTSPTPSAGFSMGVRLFGFFANAQPGTAPMYACRHPGLASWIANDVMCDGFPGASSVLLGHSPTSAGVCGSVWVYRMLNCAITQHTFTVDPAQRDSLRAMNPRNPCMCSDTGCRWQEEGWEGVRSAFY